MRHFSVIAGLLLVGLDAFAQNVETRVQTRVETQIDTVVKPGGDSSAIDISYDETAFNAVGNAKVEKEAALEAYYRGFNTVLRQLAGAQSESEIGEKFRADMERDFNTFKRRYFTSDTMHNCRMLDRANKLIPGSDKKTPVTAYTCRADGSIRVGAQDFEREMKSKERTLSNALTFVFGKPETNDPAVEYVTDQLARAFTGSGYTIVSPIGEADAIVAGKADYSLAIDDRPPSTGPLSNLVQGRP